MDLTSNDKDYLNFSISETQRVIEITKQLNSFFPNQINPKIVANIGGFSMMFFQAKNKSKSIMIVFLKV